MNEETIRKRVLFDEMLRLSEIDTEQFFDERTFQEIPCPACGAHDHQPAFRKGRFPYVLCMHCGTLFVNPRPPFGQFRAFYLRGASTKYYAERFFPPVAEARRESIFRPRAQAVAPLITERSLEVVGDIGAGFGLFCEELRQLCPRTTIVAIEPESTMAALCRGKQFPVIEKVLEDIEPQGARFDLLTAFELMEHLHAPMVFLQKARQLLKPGGYFLFTTLNIEGLDLQVLWERSKSISPPHHINFFNSGSAAILLERTGFDVVEATTPGKLDVDILEGAYRNDGIPLGRFWELVVTKSSAQAKSELQDFLARHSLSSHMRVLVRKPSEVSPPATGGTHMKAALTSPTL